MARSGGQTFFSRWLSVDNSAGPLWSLDEVVGTSGTVSGYMWTPAATVSPTYDAEGNLTYDGRWMYVWDAVNRLATMETSAAAVAARTAVAGITGGTASAIGGGKFSNGAYTAAFQHLLNNEAGKIGKNLVGGLGKGLNAISRSPLGYIWNFSNTVVGMVWGRVGLLAEVVSQPYTGKWDFKMTLGNNAIQFLGHNLAGTAETIGNTISYSTEYHPDRHNVLERHTVGRHEMMHTYQCQQLGVLYLPAILLSYGLDFIMSGPSAQCHGRWSFVERGPQTLGNNRIWNFSKNYVDPYN